MGKKCCWICINIWGIVADNLSVLQYLASDGMEKTQILVAHQINKNLATCNNGVFIIY